MSEETRSGATARRRVVVTGAAGSIAGLLLPGLRRRYELTLLDVRNEDRQGNRLDGVAAGDLTVNDRDTYRAHFAGADAVVHAAFVRPPDPVEAATVGYYGWAKACYEHLGFIFAQGTDGEAPVENVQIRIGGPRETDVERAELGDMRRVRRALAVYISQRDLVQLVVKSIEAADIRTRHGVPFQVFYGISDNSQAFWSIANARRVIGYAPQDNSEVRFREQLARHLAAAGGDEA